MSKKPRGQSARNLEKSREDRLKSALKANLARRKAQAKVRAASDDKQASDTKGEQ